MILSICMCGPAANTRASSSSMHVPPLANDRCNKTFVKDGTIHHVVWGAGTRLKAQRRVPAQGRERPRGEGG